MSCSFENAGPRWTRCRPGPPPARFLTWALRSKRVLVLTQQLRSSNMDVGSSFGSERRTMVDVLPRSAANSTHFMVSSAADTRFRLLVVKAPTRAKFRLQLRKEPQRYEGAAVCLASLQHMPQERLCGCTYICDVPHRSTAGSYSTCRFLDVRSSASYEPKLIKHDACRPYSLRCRCNRASSWVDRTGDMLCQGRRAHWHGSTVMIGSICPCTL